MTTPLLLPAITLAVPAAVPPMVFRGALSRTTPLAALPRSLRPSTPVPVKLPSTVLPVAPGPTMTTPLLLAEITLRAVAVAVEDDTEPAPLLLVTVVMTGRPPTELLGALS